MTWELIINWKKYKLGIIPDKHIAQEIGCSVSVVRRAREKMGIPALARGGAPKFDWDAQPLGIERDTDIARRLGCNPATVWQQRVNRGIPAGFKRGRRSACNWDEQPFGLKTDAQLARDIGCVAGTVRTHRIAKGIGKSSRIGVRTLTVDQIDIKYPGIVSCVFDGHPKELAEKYSVSVSTIMRLRRYINERR